MRERTTSVAVDFDCKETPESDIETVTKRLRLTHSDGLLIVDVPRGGLPVNTAYVCITQSDLLRALGRVA